MTRQAYEPLPDSVVERIKKLRLEGMTFDAIAATMGIARGTAHKYARWVRKEQQSVDMKLHLARRLENDRERAFNQAEH